MGFMQRFFSRAQSVAPKAESSVGGHLIVTSDQLEEALRSGNVSASGVVVTPDRALRVGAVFACWRLISGSVANLPLDIKRRVSDNVREDASDSDLWQLIRRKPNRWMKPAQFRKMLTGHVLLRGNAYALKVRSRGKVIELIPLDPSRMVVEQFEDDLSLVYTYTKRNGTKIALPQEEVFHLYNLTLNGVDGVTPLTYARETVGASLAMEEHGATTFKNGARLSGKFSHPKTIGAEAMENLRASLEAFRAGGEREGKDIILEEGMTYERLAMTAEDAQWIESRKFTRSDIAMFFGVPPHMIGDTEKSTSWGSGIEQQSIGFVTYTLEDYLTMWEEAINGELVDEKDTKIYAKFNRAALLRGDTSARFEAYVKALQWGIYSPDEVRALEDMNPRGDGKGGEYYDPPNTAGGQPDQQKDKKKNDPSKPS